MNNSFKPVLLASAFLFSACTSIGIQAAPSTEPFYIGLIGDYPYSEPKEIEAQNLVEDINAHDELSFVIHDGDFKGGSVPCSDEIF